MRTTLTIDDDVLAAVRDLASRQNKSLGEVMSDLARRSLRRPAGGRSECNGIPLLSPSPGAPPVTLETVNTLRDALPRRSCSTSMF